MVIAQGVILAQQMVGKGVGGAIVVGAVIVWLTSMGGKR